MVSTITRKSLCPCAFLLRTKYHLPIYPIYPCSGVMYTPVENITEQGYDMQFGTNVLGVLCIDVTYHKINITFSITCQVTFTSPSCSCPFLRPPQRTHLPGPYESSMCLPSVTSGEHRRVSDGPQSLLEMIRSKHERNLARPSYTARANW